MTFTYPDLSFSVVAAVQAYFSQALNLALSGADEHTLGKLFVTILITELPSPDFGTTNDCVTFSCVKTDEGWLLDDLPDNFLNVVTCNIISGFETLAEFGDTGDT